MSNNIADRLSTAYHQLQEFMQQQQINRPVSLIAVSKTKPLAAIAAAYQAGQRDFGENYVQELQLKATAASDMPEIRWHFIGPIQSNKTRDIARFASEVHSVERAKIAQRLSDARPAHLPPLGVYIQVNISAEPTKAGCLPDDVLPLAHVISQLPRLALRGLMAIPTPARDGDNSASFAAMAALSSALQQQFPMATALSMGMSDDWQTALCHGATAIRLGTAIFGTRDTQPHE
jgi:pyridoxal phosphate enzyme (YggS family)